MPTHTIHDFLPSLPPKDILSAIPEEIRNLKQYILWRLEPDKEGKPRKVPYQCSGYGASTTNPQHWSKLDYALEMLAKPGYCAGIGFVFTAEDPYCGVDLDRIWRSDAAEAPQWAQAIIDRFADTYGEASPSDTGYKIWCRAKAPRCGKWPLPDPQGEESGLRPAEIEIYDRGRFFTITGRSNNVPVITDHHRDIERIIHDLEATKQNESGLDSPQRFAQEIPEGKRHPALVSLAGTMVRRGVCPEAIEAALIAMNQVQCQTKYSLDHIRQIVKDSRSWDQ